MRDVAAIGLVMAVGCTDPHQPIVIDLASAEATVERTFEVAGSREVFVRTHAPTVVEGWVDGGEFADRTAEQLASGASPSWAAPTTVDDELALVAIGDGDVRLSIAARGEPPPLANRDRSLAWFDGALLDDPATISFARVMAAIAPDRHGGRLLHQWFTAFAAGPGAGRAAFARVLDDLAAHFGSDPTQWDLTALAMKVTGIHNRLDLARGSDCGELRVSIASTDPALSPVHLIFLFAQPIGDDDKTPDGAIHCRGAARRWARLASLDSAEFVAAARELVADVCTADHFLLAESVELSISPWQWRQWRPDPSGRLVNPPLFQTIDSGRVALPGPLRDDFLRELAANQQTAVDRRWLIPERFRSPVAELSPNQVAPLIDVPPPLAPELPRALAMVGCPRCHTDTADFVQTSIDRKPSRFYDRELDARLARLNVLNRGEWPPPAPFGPLSE